MVPAAMKPWQWNVLIALSVLAVGLAFAAVALHLVAVWDEAWER